jgi:hypothetical protein
MHLNECTLLVGLISEPRDKTKRNISPILTRQRTNIMEIHYMRDLLSVDVANSPDEAISPTDTSDRV